MKSEFRNLDWISKNTKRVIQNDRMCQMAFKMKILLNINTKRTGNVLVISIVFLFLVFSLFRLYPYENSIKETLVGVDDWNNYARLALDIKHNGILIPSVNGVYEGPGGFLYNYFVALCFAVFGENTIPVYIIQSVLLGLSVAFVYFAFRDKMRPITSLAFLVSLFIFALLDVYKYYSFRLLSENLGLFTVSLFIFFYIKGIEKDNLSLQTCGALFLVISILVRPNIFPFGFAFMIINLYYFQKIKKIAIWKTVLFTLFVGIGMSIIAIRNYLMCGRWIFLPKLGVSDALYQTSEFSISYLVKKVLFSFGYLSALMPDYQVRPHWLFMWVGYFTYLFYKVRSKRKFDVWEVTVHLFILFYYGTSIIFVTVGSYGFRAFIPVTFIILAFAFMALDRLRKANTI